MNLAQNRWQAVALLCSILGAASGCVSSVRPISDEMTSIPDLRLLGNWEVTNPDQEGDVFDVAVQRKTNSPNVLVATATLRGAKPDEKSETCEMFCTKIGENHFLSVKHRHEDGQIRYIIAKYQLNDDRSKLSFWGLDVEPFAKAVESGKLKGKVIKKFLTDVTLDDTAERIRGFIQQESKTCFASETTLTIKSKPAPADKTKPADNKP